MASVDVGVGLLGYGTVGSAVSRMLAESGDEIERATGHRLTVVRALVRDPAKSRELLPGDDVRKPVVSANKQLVAREGADLFAIASAAGVQLRFEASVCAAVPASGSRQTQADDQALPDAAAVGVRPDDRAPTCRSARNGREKRVLVARSGCVRRKRDVHGPLPFAPALANDQAVRLAPPGVVADSDAVAA